MKIKLQSESNIALADNEVNLIANIAPYEVI